MCKQKRHEQTDEYNVGWAHGFYSCGFQDCGSDDGSFTDPSHTLMPTSTTTEGNHATNPSDQYAKGYANGRQARNERSVARLLTWYRNTINSQKTANANRIHTSPNGKNNTTTAEPADMIRTTTRSAGQH